MLSSICVTVQTRAPCVEERAQFPHNYLSKPSWVCSPDPEKFIEEVRKTEEDTVHGDKTEVVTLPCVTKSKVFKHKTELPGSAVKHELLVLKEEKPECQPSSETIV